MRFNRSSDLSDSHVSAMMSVAPWLSESFIEHTDTAHTVTCTTLRSYLESEHVFLEGDMQSHVYLELDGVIALYKVLSDGRRQVCSFAYPGDVL